MKRNWMVPLLAALFLAVCVSLVLAYDYELFVSPGQVEETDIAEASNVGYESKITSFVHNPENGVDQPVVHFAWVDAGGPYVFTHGPLEIVYGNTSTQAPSSSVSFPDHCVYYAHVNDNGEGYSHFKLRYPL